MNIKLLWTRALAAGFALALFMVPGIVTAQTEESTEEAPQEAADASEEADAEGAADTEGEPASENPDADTDAEGAEETASGESETGDTVDETQSDAADEEAPQTADEAADEEPVEESAEEEPLEDDGFDDSFEDEAQEGDSPFGDSPISDLASDDFEPLEDIEEGTLDQIIPADVYPRFEWNGAFRVRSTAAINWDLDSRGTSAILPPLGSLSAAASPNRDNEPIADPEKETLWSTNMRLRLEPSVHITEMLELHVELDVLDNVVFGSLPVARDGSDLTRAELDQPLLSSTQLSPREGAWYEDAIQFNEVYGVARSIFGEFRAGRMDDHWGLGMWMNDGDCLDCDWGNNVDRLMVQTGGPGLFGLYGTIAMDFPDEGITSQNPSRFGNQPYDVAQIDDADQWTFSIRREPVSREDVEIQRKRLLDDDAVITNGGLLYRYRTQDGLFQQNPLGLGAEPLDPNSLPGLAYRGMSLHVFDLWTQFLWEPDFDTLIRVELEGLVGFGNINNPTDIAVGGADEDNIDAINCFDEGTRDANAERCLANDESITQYALAVESEFRFGDTVAFGLNGGFASGGATENWGVGANDFDFFRFNPDYHIDLILFRNVIGTVTNAVYYNPYVQASFLESGDRKIRLDFDAVLSHAWDKNGTPNGDSPWLGLEFDAALRYIQLEMFQAAFEAGILFPFEGLDGREGETKLTPLDGSVFETDTDAGVAWTAQFKFFWNF